MSSSIHKDGSVYAWWVVGVLSFTSVVGWLDRQILNLLIEPLKVDLGITDTQVGMLQGLAIALFYAVVTLPLGRMADQHNRRNLVLVGAMAWTAATFWCGLATGFWMLFAARALVGLGESTLAPAGMSMIGDYFSPERAARPISVLTGAGFVGSGGALLIGGAVLSQFEHLSVVPTPLGPLAVWQVAFILASAPGLLVLALLFTVREPRRRERTGAATAADRMPIQDAALFLRRRARLLVPLFGGFALLVAAGFALGAWIPSFFIRTYGWSASQIGLSYGLVTLVFGSTGVVLGGWICDLRLARGHSGANITVSIASALLAAPFVLAFTLAGDGWLALALVAVVSTLSTMPFGAGPAAIPAISPNRMRGVLMALYLLSATIVGAFGPLAVGAVTDSVFGDAAKLRYSLAVVVPFLLVAGSAVLAWAVEPFRQAKAFPADIVMTDAAQPAPAQ